MGFGLYLVILEHILEVAFFPSINSSDQVCDLIDFKSYYATTESDTCIQV